MWVAANFEEDSFELENKTGFIDILRPPPYITTGWSFIGWYYEVVDAFYVHFNVIPIYSDMNQTWGWYDNETAYSSRIIQLICDLSEKK